MKDLISIIIPIYNVEKYLIKCLESVITQTYTNIEIILINDGSTDNSLKICNEFKEKDRRILVFSKKNGGVSSARNLGIDNSTGKYILFVDSDDYLESNMVEILYKNIVLSDYDISICNYKIEKNKECTFNNIDYIKNKELKNKEYIEGILSNNGFRGYLWNKLIKKSCISKIRFDEEIHMMEDLVFLLKVSNNINKGYFDNEKYLYNYIQRESSAIYTFDEKYISAMNAYKIIFDYINKYAITNKLIIRTYSYNYVFLAMSAHYYLYKNNNIDKNVRIELNNIRKRYLKIALKNKEKGNIKKYLKIVFMSYFPILYGKLKECKNGNKNE